MSPAQKKLFFVRQLEAFHSGSGRTHSLEFITKLTSYIYSFIDNELTVSQVVENRLKVFRAAVDQVSPMLVLLVPPHIWSKHRGCQNPLKEIPRTTMAKWLVKLLCSHNIPLSLNMWASMLSGSLLTKVLLNTKQTHSAKKKINGSFVTYFVTCFTGEHSIKRTDTWWW